MRGLAYASSMLALVAWLLPHSVVATHVDGTWKYQVMLNGSNTIRISAPVYDQEGVDCWVYNGKLKVPWTDAVGTSQTEPCFYLRRNGEAVSDSKDVFILPPAGTGGHEQHLQEGRGGAARCARHTEGASDSFLPPVSFVITRLVPIFSPLDKVKIVEIKGAYSLFGCTK